MLPVPPLARSRHDWHSPHGTEVGPLSQLSALARMRALVVLPQPRGPENRYAWLTRLFSNARLRGSVTCSWPMTSAKVSGRYRRYLSLIHISEPTRPY